MKTSICLRGIWVTIVAFLVVMFFGACTRDYPFEDDSSGSGSESGSGNQSGVSYKLVNTDIIHAPEFTSNLGIDFGLATDNQHCSAIIEKTTNGVLEKISIHEPAPYKLTWNRLEDMKRSTPKFQFLEKKVIEWQEASNRTNGDLKLVERKRSHIYDFVGKTIIFTSNITDVLHKNSDIVLATNAEDSIVYIRQEHNVIERFVLGGENYLKTKTAFVFKVYRHDAPKGTKVEDFVRPEVMVSAPEIPTPGKDIFEGAIPIDGTEKLYWTSAYTYTSERQVYAFYSVSGKKQLTLKVNYDVRQSIQEPQEAFIVPNIEMGNPKQEVSENTSAVAYRKDEYPNFEFVKLSQEFNNSWYNNFRIKIKASSERAWWVVDGNRIIEMPYSKHSYNFDKIPAVPAVEKLINGKSYFSYMSEILFNGFYNNDPYDLKQTQEFCVEKGVIAPPAPKDSIKSLTILTSAEEKDGNCLSKMIFRFDATMSGTRDSVVMQNFVHSSSIEAEQRVVHNSNSINFLETLKPVIVEHSEKNDASTKHHIESFTVNHGFKFDLFTSTVTTKYQTGYTMYKGERKDFLSWVPKYVMDGTIPKSLGEVIVNEEKFQRMNYLLQIKETFGTLSSILTPSVNVDKPEKAQPTDDVIIKWDAKAYWKDKKSYIEYSIDRRLSGHKDSIVVWTPIESITLEEKKHYFGTKENESLVFKDVLDPTETEKSDKVEGNFVTTVTTVNNFQYNLDVNKVTTVHQKAYSEFMGKRTDFVVPVPPVVTYSGKTPTDMGIVTDSEGKEYNRTNNVVKYKKTYDKVTSEHLWEADVDVEKSKVVVTRTHVEARGDGWEFVSDAQIRSYFTLYEKFSDGTNKNTLKEAFLNIFAKGPVKQSKKMSSVDLLLKSLNPGNAVITNRNIGENILVTSYDVPYNGIYSNPQNQSVNSEYHFGSEKAVYKEGDFSHNFLTGSWAVSDNGFSAPLQGEIADGFDKYNRYNAIFNVNGVYGDRTFPLSSVVDIDVAKSLEPDFPEEWSKLVPDLTRRFGRISWTWRVESGKLVPVKTASFVVTKGIVNVTDAKAEFTPMDISTINSEISAVLGTGPLRNLWVASTLTAVKSGQTNPYWTYMGYDGISKATINGVDILTNSKVDINKPFLASPLDGTAIDKYAISDSGRIVIYVEGMIVYNGVSPL